MADQSNQPVFQQWTSPSDWPFPLVVLVSEARRILSYFEIPENARPPKSIWHSPNKCNEWVKDHFGVDKKDDQPFLTFNDKDYEHN